MCVSRCTCTCSRGAPSRALGALRRSKLLGPHHADALQRNFPGLPDMPLLSRQPAYKQGHQKHHSWHVGVRMWSCCEPGGHRGQRGHDVYKPITTSCTATTLKFHVHVHNPCTLAHVFIGLSQVMAHHTFQTGACTHLMHNPSTQP